MEVHFDHDKLERTIRTERLLVRKYGRATATAVKKRLTALVQSPHLGEALKLPGRLHPLKGNRQGDYAYDLPNGRRLIIRPTSPVSRLSDDGVDVRQVTAVTVIDLSDHYKP